MKRISSVAMLASLCLLTAESARSAQITGVPTRASRISRTQSVLDAIHTHRNLTGLLQAHAPSDTAGDVNFVPWDINERGQIAVLHSRDNSFVSREGLWERGVITDLGVRVGAGPEDHSHINNWGQVAATNFCDPALPSTRLVSWDHGVLREISECQREPWVIAINQRGQVLGNGDEGGFLCDHGAVTALGIDALGLNDRGQVVGTVYHYDPNTGGLISSEGVLWRAGNSTTLGTSATAINDRGQVVGTSGTHAYLWEHGVMTDLAGLPGEDAIPTSINECGQVTGVAISEATGLYRAVLWDRGVVKDLGTMDGDDESVAVLVNDRGEVYGNSYQDSPPYAHHGFVWRAGVMTSLGTLGGRDTYPNDMNQRGQIVGLSRTAAGEARAFLWQRGVMTDITKGTRFASDSITCRHHHDRRGKDGNDLDTASGALSESALTPSASAAIALQFALRDVTPNPMAGSAQIAFELPVSSAVSLAIHDASGRLVRTLAQGEFGAGRHSVNWDGRNEVGALARPGVYLVRLAATGKILSRKLVVR